MGAAGLLGALTRPSATLSQRERGWIWDGSHRPSATCETGCVKTPVPRYERPIRHSRESGNPGVLEGSPRAVSPLHPAWIPAYQAVSKLPPLPLGEGWGEATPTAQAAIDPLSLWERVGQAGVAMNGSGRVIGGPHPAFGHPLPEGEGLSLGRVAPAFGHRVAPAFGHPAKQAGVKTPVPRYERPIRHSRESGNPGVLEGAPFPHSTLSQPGFPLKAQGWWRGPHAPFPHSTSPGFPLTRPCQTAPSPSGRGLG